MLDCIQRYLYIRLYCYSIQESLDDILKLMCHSIYDYLVTKDTLYIPYCATSIIYLKVG